MLKNNSKYLSHLFFLFHHGKKGYKYDCLFEENDLFIAY